MTQPDIYDLLAEDDEPADLFVLRVRDDATGPVARWAGQHVGQPTTREAAEEIRQHMPNGRHMDLVPANHTTRTNDTKEQDQ